MRQTPMDRKSKSSSQSDNKEKIEHPILFQHYFKSVGPRTYAAQIKKATNDNLYLVLTEGRRDTRSGEIRKFKINVFSEDFEAFMNLLGQTARFIKENPLPRDFVAKRKAFWEKSQSRMRNAPQTKEDRRGDVADLCEASSDKYKTRR